MAANVIEDSYKYLIIIIQKFGWFIVAISITLYFMNPIIKSKLRELSLRQANDPYRKAILDEDRKRARKLQQKELTKIS